MDNSVDSSSQSIAHAEACSVIVERVDMALGALPPPFADCESTSSVFAFLRLAAAIFATSSDVRVEEEFPEETGDLPMIEPIPEFSGFSRDEKFKNSPQG